MGTVSGLGQRRPCRRCTATGSIRTLSKPPIPLAARPAFIPKPLPAFVPRALPDLAATGRFAARLAALARAGDAILLEGPLGAGKSALARAFLRALTNTPELEVPSPTFTLAQSYSLPGGGHATHFDLYRLRGAADLEELGWEEARQGIVLVEWPDRLGDRRPPADEALTIALAQGPTPDARWAAVSGWPGRWPGGTRESCPEA